MNLVVISTAPFVKKQDGYYAYGPYLKEMELWAKHAGPITFICPVISNDAGLLAKVSFPVAKVYKLWEFDVLSAVGILRGLLFAPLNFMQLVRGMLFADHIHLRCPGNLSLLGCFVQMALPWKKKTAKYAGNWDPSSVQPWSYRLQQKILANTWLTRRMQVMVYGQWAGSTSNIKSFFTASYSQNECSAAQTRKMSNHFHCLFVGNLSQNKNPMEAVYLVQALQQEGLSVSLTIYGEGPQRDAMEKYISASNLSQYISLKGNCPSAVIKQAYQDSHFLILPSASEGWPKVVAEAMFWGCIPAASVVSCVPYMLDYGNRGILLQGKREEQIAAIREVALNLEKYQEMSARAMAWSRQFTLEAFELELIKLVQ